MAKKWKWNAREIEDFRTSHRGGAPFEAPLKDLPRDAITGASHSKAAGGYTSPRPSGGGRLFVALFILGPILLLALIGFLGYLAGV